MKRRKKDSKVGTLVLIIITIIFIIIGAYIIKQDFRKLNIAAAYSEKILTLYTNNK